MHAYSCYDRCVGRKNMALLIKPEIDELAYRRKLLASDKTMAFAGGPRSFEKEEWQTFYDACVDTDPAQSFYGFVFCRSCNDFTGSASYAVDPETGECRIFILIHGSHRKEGYGRWAVRLLKEKAAENHIRSLHAYVRREWQADGFLKKTGFVKAGCDDTTVHYELQI